MRDPAGLYDLITDFDEVPRGLPLVAALTGFADAGAAVYAGLGGRGGVKLLELPVPCQSWRAGFLPIPLLIRGA